MDKITPIGKYLYRVQDSTVDVLDANKYNYCSETETYCYMYKIVRDTPRGVWIERGESLKFVLLDAYKKFACETVELAIESYTARKLKQLRIMRSRIRVIEESVENMKKGKQTHSKLI